MDRDESPEAGTAVGAIVLAAGLSRRMGADKLLAELAGKPVIAHVVDRIAAAGLPPPLIVIPPAGDAVRSALSGHAVSFVVADRHLEGLSQSLRAGVEAAPEHWRAAFICLGDMPLIPSALIRDMASEATADSIFVPRQDGVRGNPVLWGRSYFGRLAALHGDAGAKRLFEAYADRLRFFDTSDPGVRTDIDTPEMLDAVREQCRRLATDD
jgi:molybdenum cofactor cytidylyltransferase